MSTLSNVNTRRGGTTPPNVGLTSNVSSEAQSSQTGVSVRYVPHPDKQWFVLRATYNRESVAYDFITTNGTEAYIPMHYAQKIINGKKKRILQPLLPNILFVYSDSETVETYIKHTPQLSFLRYYYNHLVNDENGNNPPLTVRYKEMMNFIDATSIDNSHIKVVEAHQCHYKNGDMVKIIDGDFRGIEGRVARVAGQQRVVVTIEGLCSIATAYIPTAFLEIIPNKCEDKESNPSMID